MNFFYLSMSNSTVRTDLIDKKNREMKSYRKRKRDAKFKYPSNQDQFEFNEQVIAVLVGVSTANSRSGERVRKAVRKLEKRNKLIKMADRSKRGGESSWNILRTK